MALPKPKSPSSKDSTKSNLRHALIVLLIVSVVGLQLFGVGRALQQYLVVDDTAVNSDGGSVGIIGSAIGSVRNEGVNNNVSNKGSNIESRPSIHTKKLPHAVGNTTTITFTHIPSNSIFFGQANEQNQQHDRGNDPTTNTIAKNGLYLIYCTHDKPSISPLYMFFSFHHVVFDEHTPMDQFPEWNATAFLFVSEKENCRKNEYYREALRRREVASVLPYGGDGERGGDGGNGGGGGTTSPPFSNAWVNGVYWPPSNPQSQQSPPFQPKSILHPQPRPLLLELLGEVFWRYAYTHNPHVDFSIYRATGPPQPSGRFLIHYIQGVSHSYREDGGDYRVGEAGGKWVGREERRFVFGQSGQNRDGENEAVLASSLSSPGVQGFCAFLTSHVFHTFKDLDVMIRHAIFYLVNEVFQNETFPPLQQPKQCIRPPKESCPGNDLNAYACQMGYKFNINSDNTFLSGYVSEKIFNGHLSGGIPIYFGAPDVADYINPKSFIHCAVREEEVERFRAFLPDAPGGRKNRVFVNETGFWPNVTMQNLPESEVMVRFAAEFWRPYMKECLEEVKRLDGDEEEYARMVREPLLLEEWNGSGVGSGGNSGNGDGGSYGSSDRHEEGWELKGRRILRGVELAYRFLAGLEVDIYGG